MDELSIGIMDASECMLRSLRVTVLMCRVSRGMVLLQSESLEFSACVLHSMGSVLQNCKFQSANSLVVGDLLWIGAPIVIGCMSLSADQSFWTPCTTEWAQ